ncbi:MAG: AMP-binding protein [Actinomycetia bacterium]|nr:AMP-binding protein [Actinomycetes bacterium]MCP4087789.1 AMP-binding protein [Actinomycetes bacterium]
MTDTPTTVVDLFRRAGDFTLVGADGDTAVLTAVELDRSARRLATGLREWGIGAGDRIGCWLPSGAAYLTTLAACARLGAVAVAVNTRFRVGEVQDIVGRAGCRLLLVHPGFVGIDTEGILARLDPDAMPCLEAVVPVVGDIGCAWPTVPWADLMTADSSDGEGIDESAPDAPFAVFTTSGTTSKPKLVLHHQSSIVAHALDVATHFEITPDDCSLMALPLCGVFGLTLLTGGLAGGARQVVCARFNEAEAARVVADHAVSLFTGTDDMIHRMLRVGGDWSTIRYSGYARFNNALEDLPERADEAGWRLIGLYGMSEVQALYAQRDPELPIAERIAAGGRLVSPGAQARVVDPDTDQPVGAGVDGELQLKGPSLFAGYLAAGGDEIDSELTRRHLTDDGWFRTGDLARMDGPRSFEYLARMGDALRLGGFLVSPAEIEARILESTGVDSTQVVAVDGERGPRVVAFVTGDATFDEESAIAHCRQQLAAFKVPRRIIRLDEFPMTDSANGMKIQKVKLRQLAGDLVD